MLGGGGGNSHSKAYVGVVTFPGSMCKGGGRFHGPNSVGWIPGLIYR